MVRVRLGRRVRFYVAFVATLFLGVLWPFVLAGLGGLGVFGVVLKYPAVLIHVADTVDLMPPSLVIGLIALLSLFVVVLADIYVGEKAEAAPESPRSG
jgi:hypothetical protein